MINQQIIDIGNSLEALSFPTYRNGKPLFVEFTRGAAEEVAPIINGTAEATGVDISDVAAIAGGVRIARKIGISFEEFSNFVDGQLAIDGGAFLRDMLEKV